MSHTPQLNSHILRLIPRNINNQIILDIACGFGEWGFLIKTRKQGYPYLIGVDIWHPYLEKVSLLKIYDALIQTKIPPIPLKDKSIDMSLACEILEHLPKHKGYELLKELERVTRKIIVTSFPLHWPQEEILGNPYERHISQWCPENLIKMKYKTKTVELLPKTLRLFDKFRRLVFRLSPPPKIIVAWKRIE